MSVTEYIPCFKGFCDVYPSCKRLTHKLARLFNTCDSGKEKTRRSNIKFDEATERLRTEVDNSLDEITNITKRKVSEFRIGKTSVKSQPDQTFDPMEPMTWSEVGVTNGKWQEHKKDNYDGLIVVGCVTNELIPKVIKTTNTAICMDHQMYALVMAQALVQHYMVQEPDGRLRNKSIDIGNCSEEKGRDKGGIIYVAYKLESEVRDGSVIEEEEQRDVKMKLEEEGLYFRGSIPDDGNSFFKACSDQLQRLEIPSHTHTELRQMVIPNLKLCSENEIKSANFTRDTWKIYIDKVAKNKENVKDIVVEAMAKLLRRKIIIYSRSLNPTKEISKTIINEDANGPPLLLAKDKLYYQSLERQHGTPLKLQESNTSKRAANTALLDDNASPSKQKRVPQEDQRLSPGTSHAKNPELGNGPKKEKTTSGTKKISIVEKILIMKSYLSLKDKDDWVQLAKNVYKSRKSLSKRTIRYYEENLDISTKLKRRIKRYIESVKGGKRDKEKDPKVIALIKKVKLN